MMPSRRIAFHAWIREALDKNVPFDQFVREVLTAPGRSDQDAAGGLVSRGQGRVGAGRGRGPALPRPAHRLRQVPSSSARKMEPAGLLGPGRVLHACRCQGAEGWRRRTRKGPRPKPAQSWIVSMKPGKAEAINPKTKKSVKPAGLDGPELTLDAGRRSARQARRLDGRADESVLRPHAGQSLLEALPRPRPGGAGGRYARHQSADQPGAARRAGQALRGQQVRSEETGAGDLHVEHLSAQRRCRTSTTRTIGKTTRAFCRAVCTRRCCSTPSTR